MSESLSNYLDQLNQQQRDAVAYCDGPQLVIAGAGSGKTRVLTYKIVHLLHLGYEPWRILALTFTNKAAREMRERIQSLVGEKTASKLWMGTFHSVFAKILRANADRIGYKSNFTIYDSDDSKSLVKSIIKDMQLDDKVYKPATVLSSISTAKNALVSPDEYDESPDILEADRRAKRPLIHVIYRAYRDRCVVADAMDFDDLLYNTYVLLRDNPDVLRHYQEFFKYMLVDEYQDTNYAQHVIVTMLTRDSRKLCVVGDDAQSIYSFRGANIRNILDLREAYPELQTFKLERNYRSTQNIINAAGSLIEKNREQIPKNVYSENPAGAKVEVAKCYSDLEEAYQVASRIAQQKMTSGGTYDDFAILYRTNAQSRALEEALRKRNIPYRVYGGLSFYQRKEVKDAIAYFRLSINLDDDEALRRIINYPTRGIGDTTVNKLIRGAIDSNVSIWRVLCDPAQYGVDIKAATLKKLNEFEKLISQFHELNEEGKDAYTVAKKIIDATGLYAKLVHDTTPESVAKQENLQELLTGVKEFVETNVEQGLDTTGLVHFMTEVSLATDQDSDDEEAEHRVTLMTAHAAKGLEFDNVYVVGVEMDLFPSSMSQDTPQKIEEERRLLYVAITRARKFCMLTYAGTRFRNGMTVSTKPSPFLGDIDPQYLRLATGGDFRNTRTQYGGASGYGNYGGQRSTGSGRSLNELRSASRPTPAPAPAPRVVFAPPSAQVKPVSADGVALHRPEELSEGSRISHPKFGEGTVTNIDTAGIDSKFTVKFDTDVMESRTLMFKYAKFRIL